MRSEYELNSIIAKISQFQNVLIADLRITASFTVTKSGIFDVNQLVNAARNVLNPDAARNVGDEVLREIDDAGKCLAFNLSTACGFHCMRAVERVLKAYLALFLSADEMKKLNNWGQYLSALEQHKDAEGAKKPSAEAIALMRQIKEIYRNPVIHPDRTLSAEEAATLFHSTVAAISRVAFELAARQPALPGLFGGLGRTIAALAQSGPVHESDAA